MKMFIRIFLLAVLLSPAVCVAQGEANYWYFGVRAGLNFNTVPPTAVTDGRISIKEGCAAISDASGNLLFYTHGDSVWNRNHVMMDGGFALQSWGCKGSAMQAAVIVPVPESDNLYYIFSADCWEVNTPGKGGNGLKVATVDMNANGGLGQVIDKDNRIIQVAGEQLSSVQHCNGRDVWVMTFEPKTDQYFALLVTPNGITGPVISNGIASRPSYQGVMKFSPVGDRLAIAHWGSGGTSEVLELYDFDNATGVLSNGFEVVPASEGQDMWGLSFSPDNTKLYVAARRTSARIFQFDVSPGSSEADIIASRISLSAGERGASIMQLAPDGKIYFAAEDRASSLGVINNPNAAGNASNIVPVNEPGSVNLGGREGFVGLPGFIESYFNETPVDPDLCPVPVPDFEMDPEAICEGGCVDFTDGSIGADSWEWTFQDGNPGTSSDQNPMGVCFDSPGMKTITLVARNSNGEASIQKTLDVRPLGDPDLCSAPVVEFELDPAEICAGSCVRVRDLSQNADGWQWDFPGGNPANSSDQNPERICYDTPGSYTITLRASNENGSNSIQKTLTVIPAGDPDLCPPPVADFTMERTTICAGDCIDFTDASTGADLVEWDFQGGNPAVSTDRNPTDICFDTPGTYTISLTARNGNGEDTKSMTLDVVSEIQVNFRLPNVSAAPGTQGLRIPLEVSISPLPDNFTLEEVNLVLLTNSTLLDLVEVVPASGVTTAVNGSTLSVDFSTDAVAAAASFTIAELVFNTLYSFSATSTPLDLEAGTNSFESCIALSFSDGNYEQVENCPRPLIDFGAGFSFSIAVNPNPALESMSVELGSGLAGAHSLEVYNVWGLKTEHRTWQADVSHGSIARTSHEIDLRHYPSGVYQVVLRNGANVRSTSVMVLR